MVWSESYWHSQWNSQYIAVKFNAKETEDLKWWITTGKKIATFASLFPPVSRYAVIIARVGGLLEFILDWNNHNGKGFGIHFCDPNQGFFRTAGRTPFLWSN
jgi:hypothetical protein